MSSLVNHIHASAHSWWITKVNASCGHDLQLPKLTCNMSLKFEHYNLTATELTQATDEERAMCQKCQNTVSKWT